jgi:hypothetical protein
MNDRLEPVNDREMTQVLIRLSTFANEILNSISDDVGKIENRNTKKLTRMTEGKKNDRCLLHK